MVEKLELVVITTAQLQSAPSRGLLDIRNGEDF